MANIVPDHSIQLFGIACLARNRAVRSASQLPARNHRDASVAIVMAAASAEGLINELAEVASPRYLGGDDPRLATLSKVLAEVEGGRGTTTLKFLMASLILSGEMFDQGANPYQDLDQLFKLRNQHMHLAVRNQGAADGGEAAMPKLNRAFLDRGLARLDPGGAGTWMTAMQTPEMATWACEAASNAMIAILDMLPMGPLTALGWKPFILAYLESTEIEG
jgi:hypothetical protein